MVEEKDNSIIRIRLKQIYDSYRTALMNQKYYRYELARLQNTNLGFEIIIAVGATGTSLSAWALWKTDAGQIAWGIIAGLAALIAIAKPIVGLGKKIEKYTKLYAGYTDMYFKLKELKEVIEYEHNLTSNHDRVYEAIPGLFRELGVLEESPPKRELLDECYNEVNAEHPPKTFWMPS